MMQSLEDVTGEVSRDATPLPDVVAILESPAVVACG